MIHGIQAVNLQRRIYVLSGACLNCRFLMEGLQAVRLACRRRPHNLSRRQGVQEEGRLNASPESRLVVRTPGGQAHEFPLTQLETTIGRARSCDLVLESAFVSRKHARVAQRDEGFVVVDEGSTNGTTVNGERVVEVRTLADGDRITIANITLDFVTRGSGETTRTPLMSSGRRPSIECDSTSWEAWVEGQKVEERLSVQEFELLSSLARKAGAVCTREELGRAIWGEGNFDYNMLHQLVHRVRGKLPAAHRAALIESVPGVGYRVAGRASSV